MLLTVTGKHISVTDVVREHAEKKTSKLPKFYDGINQVDVVLDGSPGIVGVVVEIIARAEHGGVFVARETGTDICLCIDQVVRRLEEQLRRKKKKQRNRKHAGGVEPSQNDVNAV